MTEEQKSFINLIAPLVQKYAPMYGINVCSPIIAQAILESSWGTSNKAKHHNYFGLKYRLNRLTCNSGIFKDSSSEQLLSGNYVEINTDWYAFNDAEDGVHGYFQFINTPNYDNLKGVTDPKTYLENIKGDGYATSLNYVNNLMKVIEVNNLTQYDVQEVNSMSKLKIAIDAGHGKNTSGKRCMKKLDTNETREWVLNSRIANKLEQLLKPYECEVLRVDDITGNTDVSMSNRVSKANSWGADVYISIHHNAGINGRSGGGTVVFYYSSKAERKTQAEALYKAVVNKTSLVGNRSEKVKNYGFYVIKNTKMPAFLIENGFMDSPTDVPIILSDDHADKTAQGLLNFLVDQFKLIKASSVEQSVTDGVIYRVQCGAYRSKANAEALKDKLLKSGFEAVVVSGTK